MDTVVSAGRRRVGRVGSLLETARIADSLPTTFGPAGRRQQLVKGWLEEGGVTASSGWINSPVVAGLRATSRRGGLTARSVIGYSQVTQVSPDCLTTARRQRTGGNYFVILGERVRSADWGRFSPWE